jgi:predicted ATPase
MRLATARVRLFRSIVDSGPVAIEPDVTSLLGKNESGKTTFLQALYGLNPAYEADQAFDLSRDYPRWRKTRDAREFPLESVTPIEGTFELELDEIAAAGELLSMPLPARVTLTVGRAYGGELQIRLNLTEADLHPLLTRCVTLGGDTKLAGEACRTPAELAVFAREALSAVPKEDRDATKALRTLAQSAQAAADLLATGLTADQQRKLAAMLPRFFYFSEVCALHGRNDLTALLAKAKKPSARLEEHERTVMALLRLAGVDGGELLEGDFESRMVELEAAANELSGEVFRYWSQNRDIRVSLVSDAAVPAGHKEGTIHRFLDIRLHDLRHQVTTSLERRSPGFRWFFSFVTAFSEFGRERNVIILLDEPGLGLHAQAQCDLLRFIDDRIARRNQLLYTTHSPFMLNPSALHRIRVVEDHSTRDDPELGTRVFAELGAAAEATALPLRAALGYQLARNGGGTSRSLVVRGPANLAYLATMSEHLAARGRESLDPRWQLTSVGASGQLGGLLSLLGNSAGVTVLEGTASSARTQAADDRPPGPHRVVAISRGEGTGGADLEDLFERSEYLDLCRAAFGAAVDGLASHEGISARAQLESALGRNADPAGPARALLREKARFLERTSEATVARFEGLIRRINATLDQGEKPRTSPPNGSGRTTEVDGLSW